MGPVWIHPTHSATQADALGVGVQPLGRGERLDSRRETVEPVTVHRDDVVLLEEVASVISSNLQGLA